MKWILLIAILMNVGLMAFLWRMIRRTNQVFQKANQKLKEIQFLDSLHHARYHDDVPIMMADNIRTNAKHKLTRLVIDLN